MNLGSEQSIVLQSSRNQYHAPLIPHLVMKVRDRGRLYLLGNPYELALVYLAQVRAFRRIVHRSY